MWAPWSNCASGPSSAKSGHENAQKQRVTRLWFKRELRDGTNGDPKLKIKVF